MNAAFLIMSSAALAGADPAPTTPPPAPVVVSGAGCNNCGAPPSCCSKPGIFDKIKARFSGFGKKSSCGCAPACPPAPCPAPCPPVKACAPPPCPPPCPPAPKCCPTSIADRPNLLDNLKARWGSKKSGPCCDPCGATTVISPPPTGGTTPPKEMPKPKDEKPKGGNTSSVPSPFPPVSGAGLSSGSPY